MVQSFFGQPATTSYAPKMSCPPFSHGTAATRVGADCAVIGARWIAYISTTPATTAITIDLRMSASGKVEKWKV